MPSSAPRPRVLNFITGNPNKLSEVRTILMGPPTVSMAGSTTETSEDAAAAAVVVVELQSKALDLDEIQGTIEEIARDKCRKAADAVGGPVLTEDTALEFHALKGLPGPYIKDFLLALGHEGLNNLLAAYEDKSACSVCTFAYSAGPGEQVLLFQGRTEGKIVPARGPPNFGWDPIFEFRARHMRKWTRN